MTRCTRRHEESWPVGAIALLLLAVAVIGVKWYPNILPSTKSPTIPDYIDTEQGTFIVGYRAGGTNDGVYYLPAHTTLGAFFDIIGHDKTNIDHSRLLLSGDMVTVRNGDGGYIVTVSAMNNVDRMALGLPIDVNSASVNDFMMIPGVGRQLAEALVEERTRRGHFSGIDDLKGIHGVGEKKLNVLSNYLYF